MKILDVNIYRDGGTKLIITDEGPYWIRLDKKCVQENVEVSPQKVIELLDAMCYNASSFHWIKRHVNNGQEEGTYQII